MMSRAVSLICWLSPSLLVAGTALVWLDPVFRAGLTSLGMLLIATGVILAAVAVGLVRAGCCSADGHVHPPVLPEPPARPGPGERSADGQGLTKPERDYIWGSAVIAQCARCPDCGGILIGGPGGGMSRNCACGHCGSEFNITILPAICLGERISPPGPRALGERGRLYGLPEDRVPGEPAPAAPESPA